MVMMQAPRNAWAGWAALAAFLVVGVPALGVAQDGDPIGGAKAAAGYEQAEKLSGKEKLARAERYISSMKEILKKGFDALAEARSEKDVVKMTCVNEKLTAQKGLLKVIEQAYIQLQDAVAKGDAASSNHEFTKVLIGYQKMRGLGVEVESCAGEALRYAGETKVVVEVSEDIAAGDPTVASEERPVLDTHPEAASPFE